PTPSPIPPTTLRDDSVRTHGGLTGGREGKGRDKEGEATFVAEPPIFCPSHPYGANANCGACADARRLHEQWARTSKPAAQPTLVGIVTEADCDVHPGRPKRGCDRCAEAEGVA